MENIEKRSRFVERAEYFAKNQRCKRCGAKDAYTIVGRSLCYECAEKNRKYSKKHYEKYGNGMKARYDRLKAEGICCDCGKRKAEPNRTRCAQCLVKNNRSAKKTQGKSQRITGYCWLCNKRPTTQGTGLCEVCLPRARERIKKAQTAAEAKKMQKKMEVLDMQEYNISNMEKCEYIEAMKKVYCKPPEQKENKCMGFRNKYNGDVSLVCKKCKHWSDKIDV